MFRIVTRTAERKSARPTYRVERESKVDNQVRTRCLGEKMLVVLKAAEISLNAMILGPAGLKAAHKEVRGLGSANRGNQ